VRVYGCRSRVRTWVGLADGLQTITALTSAPVLASEDAADWIVRTVLIPHISRIGLLAAIILVPHRPLDGFGRAATGDLPILGRAGISGCC
jgi:hypothetical protein